MNYSTRNTLIFQDASSMLDDLDDSPIDGECCTPETEYTCSVCVEATAIAMADQADEAEPTTLLSNTEWARRAIQARLQGRREDLAMGVRS